MKRSLITILMIMAQLFLISNASNVNVLDAKNPIGIMANVSKYAVIKGIVSGVDVSERSKVIFLNFGNNYNTSFSAVIYENKLPAFIMAGVNDPVDYYKNKTVKLEGFVRMINGKPEMVIESPSQIKIIDKNIKLSSLNEYSK